MSRRVRLFEQRPLRTRSTAGFMSSWKPRRDGRAHRTASVASATDRQAAGTHDCRTARTGRPTTRASGDLADRYPFTKMPASNHAHGCHVDHSPAPARSSGGTCIRVASSPVKELSLWPTHFCAPLTLSLFECRRQHLIRVLCLKAESRIRPRPIKFLSSSIVGVKFAFHGDRTVRRQRYAANV